MLFPGSNGPGPVDHGSRAAYGLAYRPAMTRLVLAPGLRVQHRSAEEVQLGLEPGHRLRATTAVRRALAPIDRGEAPGPSARPVAALAPFLVDADALGPAGIAPGDAAAAALADPTGFAARLAARRTRTVAVRGSLGTDPAALLTAAGLRVHDDNPDAVLLLCTGEPDRDPTDLLVRDGIPHLLVRLVEGAVVVGPLVVPGYTACLRCLDAHRAVRDPLYPVLAAAHHRALRHDGTVEPADTALVALGVAWAARDLVTHLDGDRAATWSATVRITADLGDVRPTRWLRHPGCSCVWAADDPASSTMAV